MILNNYNVVHTCYSNKYIPKFQVNLKDYINNINNIEKIEFLPYHTLGKEKYKELGIPYSYENIKSMDKEKCIKLYNKFINM